MPRVKPKALSAPPSQEALEDGADSTSLFTSNTVAALSGTRTTKGAEKMNTYKIVTEKIINLLECGVIPWRSSPKVKSNGRHAGATRMVIFLVAIPRPR